MFDKEVSVAMSKRNALGLADMLVKHMPDGSSAQPSTAAMLAARSGKAKGMPLQPEAAKPMGLEAAAPVLAPLPKVGGPIPLASRFAPLREGSKP
jgi:Rod binding domain-containing protein